MLENTNTKQTYPGPILNTTLQISTFLFKDPEQVKLTKTYTNDEGIQVEENLTYGTDYEVTKTLADDISAADASLTASVGEILLKPTVSVLAGQKLTAYRESELTQEVSYPRTGPFPAKTHEGALDYLTMQNQEQQEQIDRSLKVPVSTGQFNASMPIPIAARALKINSEGTGFEMSEYDPDTALETTKEYMQDAQNAANAALASQSAAASSAQNATEQATIATEQATIATTQAEIATAKASEVVESGDNAITAITAQETTSKNNIETKGAEQIELIQNEGATQIANVQSTGFYMRDDKLYFINFQGEETEFKSGGASSRIYDSGVSEDEIGYNKVLALKNSGSETGIDTLKPDDYTVVGNPVITSDGIASGFSSANYIKPKNFGTFQDYTSAKIETDIVFNNFEKSRIMGFCDASYNGMFLNIYSNGEFFGIFQNNSTTVRVRNVNTFTVNKKYKITFEYSDGFCKLYIDGVLKNTVPSTIDIPVLYGSNFKIGSITPDLGNSNNCNIDLNSVKIYIDDQLVYQPCLKIPYTQAKTGAKIVDAQYRDRVQDWYEQSGEGNYYTIDEENRNFSLALPDIYGLIEKNYQNLPIGMMFPCMCSSEYVPFGALPCDGAEYTKAQFPDLWANWLISGKLLTCTYSEYQADITNYGKCGRFAVESTNNKFKVPTIPDGCHIQQAQTDTELAKSYNAGLQNIIIPNTGWGASGVQPRPGTVIDAGKLIVSSGQAEISECLESLNASRNSLTLSDTGGNVQPNAISYRWFVMVATGTVNQSQMDWSQWASSLANRTTLLQAASASMPSNRYIDLTLGASGSTYTAPADGYFVLSKKSTASGQYIIMNVQNTISNSVYASSVDNVDSFLPVKKGAIMTLYYGLAGTTNRFRFIYAEGAQ